ncbi:MAG: hypothetical protein JNJ90_06980 [Saprospiraceae bacterium]|jgi:hypothetical protein|nr:hypothetical protein [Saprospiraceae bacterium]
MKKLLYEYSDFFLIYSVMFTSLAISRAIPYRTFSITIDGFHFAAAFVAAVILFGYKKYSHYKKRQEADKSIT